MSNWCYRPCKIVHEDGTETWDVRSFYYGENDEEIGWSQNAANPFGESLDELKSDLLKMAEGIEKDEPLVLYVFTCSKCNEKDARPDKNTTICGECLEPLRIK